MIFEINTSQVVMSRIKTSYNVSNINYKLFTDDIGKVDHLYNNFS